jgi:periplasmic copper chaperone A
MKSFQSTVAAATAATLATIATVATLSLSPTRAQAETPPVKVSEVWVRTTVPGAKVSAAYMQIESAQALKLIKAETPVAGIVELHDSKMKDGVMEMKAEAAFAIPANQRIELKPNGRHVMLFKLKQPIKPGERVPLTLTFESADKKRRSLTVDAVGRDSAAAPHQH